MSGDDAKLCAAEGCGGVLAGSVGFLWCAKCGERHERAAEITL